MFLGLGGSSRQLGECARTESPCSFEETFLEDVLRI